MAKKASTDGKKVREIKRKRRKLYAGEEKIRIVVDGLCAKGSVSELCRHKGITESLYYRWSKVFQEAGDHS